MTNSDLLKILLPSVAGVAAFAYYLAHLAEHGVSEFAKQELIKFAKKRSILPASRAAFKFFLYVADRFFGKDLFSWKAFMRSILLSAIWICLVLAICSAFFPNYRSWLTSAASRHLILGSAFPLISVSLLIDFLSTALTRKIIRSSVGKRSTAPPTALLLDLFCSVLLFYLIFTATKAVIIPGHASLGPLDSLRIWLNPSVLPTQIQLLQDLREDMLVPTGNGGFDIKGGLMTEIVYAFPESILFLSSMLTSIWLWLYLLAYLLLYMAVRLDRVSAWIRHWLNIDHNPTYAIATAVVISYTIVCMIALVANSLYLMVAT